MNHHTEVCCASFLFSSINVCEGFLTYGPRTLATGQTDLQTKNYGKKLVSSQCWIKYEEENGTGLEPWTQVKKKWWQRHETGATVDTTRPQRKRATKEKSLKRSGERNVDSWRKMEAVAQDRAGWRQVVYGLCMFHCMGATRHKPNVYTFTLTVSCINYVFLPRDASAERGYEIACRLSVCPSVCLSVCL